MTDIVCPLCGKPNPPDLNECQYCQAPLKPGGFISPLQGEGEKTTVPPFSEDIGPVEEQGTESKAEPNLEQSIPDWLKETEASFTEEEKPISEEPGSDQLSIDKESPITSASAKPEKTGNAIDEDWLASLLVEAGAVEPPTAGLPGEVSEEPAVAASPEEPEAQYDEEQGEEPAIPTAPADKPDWLASLEASSKIKMEGEIFASEAGQVQPLPAEAPEEKPPEPVEPPEWLTKAVIETPSESPKEAEPPAEASAETPIAPAELPGWLEALRPEEPVSPTGPVEDVSGADIITAGPLMGLKGVISSHPSAIRAQKPPTYSIKLRVTEEQQARLQMMEELLEDEGKSKPLPSKSVISSRNIFRLVVAVILLLPMIWMIISGKQKTALPQPANIPGVVDFNQHIQALPAHSPVLVAFDYEAGFSGELDFAITNVITQLMKKQVYMALASTSPSGPALAESMLQGASLSSLGTKGAYSDYANLGYIPGGTMGLLSLAGSLKSTLPYSLDSRNVWTGAQLANVSGITDFSAVIVITGDPDTARIWIEQVGTKLSDAGTPLLFVTSAQAEPLIRPYYQATPSQVQGLIAGITGGVAYAQAVGSSQQNGVWDAYSAGITISILIILVGSIAGIVLKMLPAGKMKET